MMRPVFALALMNLVLALAPAAQDEAPPPREEEPQGQERSLPETPEEWSVRVDRLVEESTTDSAVSEELQREIDAHYRRLLDVLDAELHLHDGVFRTARSTTELVPRDGDSTTRDLTVADLYQALLTLYNARLRLLEVTSPHLHALATGMGVEGTRELKLELRYIVRHTRYQRLALPEGFKRIARDFRAAPFPVLRGLLVLVLSLVAFRAWRRWAGKGLTQIREFLRSAWPREAVAQALAGFVWYVERTRKPLEWLALVLLIFSIAKIPEIPEPRGVTRIGAVWILLAWFAVLLVDAYASRATSPWKVERSPIRLRSLGVVAAWLLVLGLGLHLAYHLAGRATTFAWVFRLFQILAVPVALVLFRIWRPLIKEKMLHEARFSERVAKAMERRGKRFGLTETAASLAYLLALGLRRLSLQLARRTALGRTLVAEALRQKMVRGATKEDEGDAAVEPGLRRDWLDGESFVASAVEDELKQAKDRLERGWPFIGVVAERGGGKTSFVRRFCQEYPDDSLLVSTPRGGADATWAALCRALEIPSQSDTEKVGQVLDDRSIKLLILDNLHLLVRPILGGQYELDRLVKRFGQWRSQVTILGTIDNAAWQYINVIREGSLSGAAVIELSAWTEGQIGELIERRAADLGIELSYDRLTFPRLFLEQRFDTPEDGVRASFRRILWSESDGNPAAAMRIFLDALVREPDGRYAVQLPSLPATSELDGVRQITLLLLRFLLQTDGATAPELVAGLRYPEPMIKNALLMITMRGWTEEHNGYYRVSWKWFRTITRVLFRRNYLSSIQQREDDGQGPNTQYRYRVQRGYRSWGPYQAYGPQRPAAQWSYRGMPR